MSIHYKLPPRHELWDEDYALFERMESNYTSKNEENFFKIIKFKEEYEYAPTNELLVSEFENDDQIYFDRIDIDEYLVGCCADGEHGEVHLMNLSEALAVNLKDIGFRESVTLLEWLRRTDYKYLRYDTNENVRGRWTRSGERLDR